MAVVAQTNTDDVEEVKIWFWPKKNHLAFTYDIGLMPMWWSMP